MIFATQSILLNYQTSKQAQKANISQKQEPIQNEKEIKQTEETAKTTEKKVTKKIGGNKWKFCLLIVLDLEIRIEFYRELGKKLVML